MQVAAPTAVGPFSDPLGTAGLTLNTGSTLLAGNAITLANNVTFGSGASVTLSGLTSAGVI